MLLSRATGMDSSIPATARVQTRRHWCNDGEPGRYSADRRRVSCCGQKAAGSWQQADRLRYQASGRARPLLLRSATWDLTPFAGVGRRVSCCGQQAAGSWQLVSAVYSSLGADVDIVATADTTSSLASVVTSPS